MDSRVSGKFHVLEDACKDARINGGKVAVDHEVLVELLSTWEAVHGRDAAIPEAAIADQLHVGPNPALPIHKNGE